MKHNLTEETLVFSMTYGRSTYRAIWFYYVLIEKQKWCVETCADRETVPLKKLKLRKVNRAT